MSTATDIISRLTTELIRFVNPLVLMGIDEKTRRQVFDAIGWDFTSLTGFPVNQLTTDIQSIAASLVALVGSAENGIDNFGDIPTHLSAIASIFSSVNDLSQLAQTAQVSAEGQAALAKFGEDVVQFLVVEYLERYWPLVLQTLRLLTLVETSADGVTVEAGIGGTGGQPVLRRSMRLPRVRFDRLPALLQDPITTIHDDYIGPNGIATADDARNTAGILFDRLGGLAAALGAGISDGSDVAGADTRDSTRSLAIRYDFPVDGALASLGAVLSLISDAEGGAGVVIAPTGWITTSWDFRNWVLTLTASGEALSFTVRPSGVTLPGAMPAFDLTVALDRQSSSDAPAVLIGAQNSTRFEIGSLTATVEFHASSADWDIGFSTSLKKCAIVVAAGQGDGFLAQVLPADGLSAEFDFLIGWSRKKGVYFSGGALLELELPLNLTLGPITVESIYLAIKLKADGSLQLILAGTAGIVIGPVAGVVERLGIALPISFPSGGGNLGPLEAGVDFKPPNGVGLAIDAGPVSGGGYISFDPDAGRYAGILQLTLPILSITAIGLLDTKLPDGRQGYSFLIIIACDFPPIQLGYGFVLTGLGGLAGINRSLIVQALQDGVHSGAVNDILFPEDPIDHAPELISDLESIFPPTEGQYVFGPMAELGWGEPDPLIIAELGIIITLPNPIVITLLGKLEISLPEPDSPVVDLHVEIAGSLDLTNKLLAIDASLNGSRILAWSISGDISLRLAFGSQPSFLFAMGGFNPHFQPPPGFKKLERLALSLSTGDNPRLSLDTYLAVTSNTIQVGANAQAYIKFDDFKASGDFGFDALFHFGPFSFITDVEADVQVKGPLDFSASVHLDAHLSGADPYRCWGLLVIHFMGTHKFPIDIPFGQTVSETPAIPPNPWDQLKAEIGRTGNWSASLAGDGRRAVVLAAPEDDGTNVYIDPVGGLTLRQKSLPLSRSINKVGETPLPAPVSFDIQSVSAGTLALGVNSMTAASGPFAAAQFEQMSDAEKLSRPSFEPMKAGVAIASDALAFGPCQGRDYAYSTSVADSPAPPKPYTLSAVAQQAAHLAGPAAKAPSQTTGMGKYAPAPSAPPAAQMSRAKYAIGDVATLQNANHILASLPDPPEKGAMMRALAAYYAKVPADRGNYAVMGAWEVT